MLSEKSCPGLLVSILEAFEELGLTVLEARVSCTDNLLLQAVGGEVRSFNIFFFFLISITKYQQWRYIHTYVELAVRMLKCFFQDEEQGESINAQVVKQAVVQAIKNWNESTE